MTHPAWQRSMERGEVGGGVGMKKDNWPKIKISVIFFPIFSIVSNDKVNRNSKTYYRV